MDPLLDGILITEAFQNMAQECEKEKQHMDSFHLYEYTQIRHQERLEQALNQQPGELAPSLIWRMIAFARRVIKTALSVRVSFVVRTQADPQSRPLTEPDMCID